MFRFISPERLFLWRSGLKAAAVAFRPSPVATSNAVSHSNGDLAATRSGPTSPASAPRFSRFAASTRGLAVVGALALSATLGALQAHAGAVRTDAAFAANTLARNDDGSTGLVNLGFTANFFGTNYTQVYVNNNGNVTFDGALAEFTPFDLTSTNRAIIAPFFADIDTRGSGSQPVRYGQSFGVGVVNGRPAFGANYINVGYFASKFNKLNSFQVVLIDRSDVGAGNFDIELNYDKVQFETGDSSGGVNGLGGNSARAGFSNGSGNAGTFFELPGSAVNGAFLDSNTSTGLIYNSLNSNVPGRYIFQVRNGTVTRTLSIGDVSLNEGNSGTTNANFTVTLSPTSDQTVTVDYATADGTATQPSDYAATSGTLTFTAGQTTQTISVPVVGDTAIEPNETFFVNLSNPTGGASLGDAQGLGTITNDDANSAPSVSDINITVNEDTTFTFSAAIFDNAFRDPDGQTLQSVIVQSPPANGTLRRSGSDITGPAGGGVIPRSDLGNLTFTPSANFNGSTSFLYRASDGTTLSNTASVNITVVPVNDAPTISDIADRTIGQDTSTGAIDFTVGDVDNAPASLTLSATSSNPSLVPVANIVFGGSGTNRTVTVTPAAGASGTSTITVTVSDGSLSASDSFVLTVTAVNQGNRAPVVDNQTLSASLNRAFSIPLAGSDPDGDPLSYAVAPGSTLPPGTTLSSDGILSGTPTQLGTFGFSLDVSDGRGGVTRANYLLVVTNRLDGQGPILTRVVLPSPTTRDQLAALTLSGTVRDVAATGVTPSGVRRVLFQLRRVSDGFAYSGSAFTSNLTLGYYVVPLSGATSDPAGTRTYGRSLSFLPPASVLTPGRYDLGILSQDNAGNYSVNVVSLTIVAPVASAARVAPQSAAPSANSS